MPLNNFSVHKSLEKCRKRIMQVDFIEGFLSREFSCEKAFAKTGSIDSLHEILKTFYKSKCEEG